MGKSLINQRRGKGSPTYVAPGHRFFGDIKYEQESEQETNGFLRAQVLGFIDDPGRSVLIAEILLENGKKLYNIAAEGLLVGQEIQVGRQAKPGVGSVLSLEKIPDSTLVFNVEKTPRDGGRFARSSGASALVVSHDEETGLVNVMLPSKQVIALNSQCRATVGVACGAGREEKPFKKASSKMFASIARNKYYPIVRGRAKSAYAHPFGGKTGGKPTTVSRHAPPGRKVGHIAARRTGRRRGKVEKTGRQVKQG